jgi:phosphate uptake regulator|tara:strand:+ start:3639 stop:4037 length:399 start_codon:yes stop_codon:yes gene_type:complete
MKNILLTILSVSILSCGALLNPASQVAESTNPNEKFLGTFEFQIFDLPMSGDVIVSLTVKEDEDGLTSVFESLSGELAEDIVVKETEIEEDILYIDVLIQNQYDIFFELYVEGDEITGYLADMFELAGKKVD